MKRLLLLALFSGSFCEAFAKDSDWKICRGEVTLFNENVKIIVSSYEHRVGIGRANDMTFIYGGNVLHGSLDTSEDVSGPVKLTGNKSTFKGTAGVNYQTGILSLKGKLTLNKSSNVIDTDLTCETL